MVRAGGIHQWPDLESRMSSWSTQVWNTEQEQWAQWVIWKRFELPFPTPSVVAIAVNSIRMLELNTSPLDGQRSAFESPHSPSLGLGLLTSKAQAVRLLRLRARRHLESRPGREHLCHMLATYPNTHILISATLRTHGLHSRFCLTFHFCFTTQCNIL